MDRTTDSAARLIRRVCAIAAAGALCASGGSCGFAGVGAPQPAVNATTTATTGIETPARVAVTPLNASLRVGDSVQFVATGIRANGVSGSFGTPAWSFGPDSIGTLSNTVGNDTWLRVRKPGTAMVYAIVSGVTGSASVTVAP